MAIIKKEELPETRRQIDLTGPEGNAFALLGVAMKWKEQMGMSKKDRDELHEEMTSGDYEKLIEIFDREFGSFCDLIR